MLSNSFIFLLQSRSCDVNSIWSNCVYVRDEQKTTDRVDSRSDSKEKRMPSLLSQQPIERPTTTTAERTRRWDFKKSEPILARLPGEQLWSCSASKVKLFSSWQKIKTSITDELRDDWRLRREIHVDEILFCRFPNKKLITTFTNSFLIVEIVGVIFRTTCQKKVDRAKKLIRYYWSRIIHKQYTKYVG